MTAILNPVKVATNAPLSTTTYVEGNYIDSPLRIDGVNIYLDDRVLFKSQTNPIDNGVYVVSAVSLTEIVGGATQLRNVLVRASDMLDAANIFASTIVFVQEGNSFADTGWVITSAPAAGDVPLTVGTDALTFVRFTINPNVALGDAVLSTLVLRRDKGYPLTNDELDNNFKYLGLSLSQKVDIEDYTAEVITGKINTLSYVEAGLNANRLHSFYPTELAVDELYPDQTTVVLRTLDSKINATTFVGDLDGSAALLEGENKAFYTNVNNIASGQLAVEHGGTAANSASGARTSLKLLGTEGNETMTGKLKLAASTLDRSSLNIPNGVAPTVKLQGDLFATSNELKYITAASESKTLAFLESPTLITPILKDNPASTSNSKAVATTSFVQGRLSTVETNLQDQIDLKATIASPTLTGIPKAPDIGKTTFSQIATKTYVDGAITANNNFYYTKAQIDTKFTDLKGGSTRTIKQLDDDIQSAKAQIGVPVGTVMYFAANSVPLGWLECNGDYVTKTTYPHLYNKIGSIYGETATKFKLPDLRGEFIRGHDNGRGVDEHQGWPRESARGFGSSQSATAVRILLDTYAQGIGPSTLYSDGTLAVTGSNVDDIVYGSQINRSDIMSYGSKSSSGAYANYGIGTITVARDDRYISASASLSAGSGDNVSFTVRPRNVALKPCIKAFGEIDNADQILAAGVIADLNNKVDKAGGTMTGKLTLSADPTSTLHAATKQYVDNSISAIELLPGPVGPQGPVGPVGPVGPRGPAGSTYKFTSGANYSSTGYTNQVGSFNNSKNYFDVFPPSGYSMSNLIGFIASIWVIHYAGGVDGNDSIRCTYEILADRVRVRVQGTEQRSTPAASWFAVWA